MTDSAGSSQGSAADATATFLVSLYLVLLAFFILLAVISSFDAQKSERVMHSVTSRLGPGPGWVPDALDLASGTAEAEQAAGDLRRDLREAFEAELPGVRFGVRQSGRVLEAIIPIDLLFPDDAAYVPRSSGVLMGRIAKAVTAALPAVRCRIEIVMRGGRAEALSAGQIAVRRADALARGLRGAGLPEAWIMAGAEPAAEPEVRFVFRILGPSPDMDAG